MENTYSLWTRKKASCLAAFSSLTITTNKYLLFLSFQTTMSVQRCGLALLALIMKGPTLKSQTAHELVMSKDIWSPRRPED